jgi:hypothetical protein
MILYDYSHTKGPGNALNMGLWVKVRFCHTRSKTISLVLRNHLFAVMMELEIPSSKTIMH